MWGKGEERKDKEKEREKVNERRERKRKIVGKSEEEIRVHRRIAAMTMLHLRVPAIVAVAAGTTFNTKCTTYYTRYLSFLGMPLKELTADADKRQSGCKVRNCLSRTLFA